MKNIPKTEQEWKQKLTAEQYKILREKDTEAPGSGHLLHNKDKGDYTCSACDTLLFKSNAKFDSGTGWPSFDQSIPGAIELKTDLSHGMIRTEVICKTCKSHLGHIFNDGPTQTGKRFCINSVCLKFNKK